MVNDATNNFDQIKHIAESTIAIVDSFIVTFSEKLIRTAVKGERGELRNARHRDNFLSNIDMELHTLYATELTRILPTFIYASEESEPQLYPADSSDNPEYVVIVDPLDTSELAVRGLHGYTQVVVFSVAEQRPVVAVVGDMFHDIRIFCAYYTNNGKDRAFLRTRHGRTMNIRSSQETLLNKALVTSYLMRPNERFKRVAEEHAFLDALSEQGPDGIRRGRIGVDFGSIGLCHVAAGFTDAYVEIAKGFNLWDLFPGQYILEASGGIVVAPDGTRLSLKLPLKHIADVRECMNKRQKFIAAGNISLLNQIISTLSHKA